MAIVALACAGGVAHSERVSEDQTPTNDGAPAVVDEPPAYWSVTGSGRDNYSLITNGIAALSGDTCAVLRASGNADPFHFGATIQFASAVGLRGKRVEYSGYIRTENAPAGASIWMRADEAQGTMVAFDNTFSRGIRGTQDWSYQSVVIDIPETAAVIGYGAILQGQGSLYIDDLHFRIVDSSVRATAMPIAPQGHSSFDQSRALPEPRNLDFEEIRREDTRQN